jgi:hypothetical protein
LTSAWQFILAMPNLRLSSDRDPGDSFQWPSGIDLGSGVVSVMGGDDPPIRELRADNQAVDSILAAFRDEYGASYVPAVLVARTDAPESLLNNAAAFTDFRNGVALSCILRGRASTVGGNGRLDPSWADTFDFHPAQVGCRGNVVVQSPALLNLIVDDELHFAPSPAIPVFALALHPDQYVYRCVGREWGRRYLRPGRNDSFSRTLFRSLEVAFQAASVGTKSFGSAVEYGLQVASWVSAIEILAWPSARHADYGAVAKLLRLVELPRDLRHKRYTISWKKQRQRVGAVEWCYWLLNKARNDFLHGNPVSFKTLLAKSRGEDFALSRVAAILYRYALVAFLGQRYRRTIASTSDFDRLILEIVDERSYEEALRSLLGHRRD